MTGIAYKFGAAGGDCNLPAFPGFNGGSDFDTSSWVDDSDNVIASPPIASGANPTVYIQPEFHTVNCANPYMVTGFDTSKHQLDIWANVADDGAIDPELMGSVGLNIADSVVSGTTLPTYSLTLYTTQANTGNPAAVDAWDGTNIVSPPIDDARAVTVPESVADFAVTGIAPTGASSVRIGRLSVEAPCVAIGNPSITTVELRLEVGNVLIARVGDPADPAPGAEDIDFGWTGVVGTPEGVPVPGGCGAAFAGSCSGATSTIADATVVVTWKGDVNGDTFVSPGDNGAFNLAKAQCGAGAESQIQRWRADTNCDGLVGPGDNGSFNLAKNCHGSGYTACP
jgi:hypothetical protein